MQTPAHGRLWGSKTICGQPIPDSAEGVLGHFVRSVRACHQTLGDYGLASVQPPSAEEKAKDPLAHHNFMYRSDDAERYICQVAQRLIEERDNPAHYGDNLPGWFDMNHKPITPARFSFSDLIGFGPNPETGGVKGFLAICQAKSYEDLEIAAGLLSLDEAMQFASTDLAYAFHLLGEAQSLQESVELARLRRDLSAEVSEEALETVFSQLEALKQKHQRIREGGRVGGTKGAETRRQNSPLPDVATLVTEREKLIAGGTEERWANGVLAKRYTVTRDAVAKRLRGMKKR